MGWASASEYPVAVAEAMLAARVPAKHRAVVYKALCAALMDGDWDTQDECYGVDLMLDGALLDLGGREIDAYTRDGDCVTGTVAICSGGFVATGKLGKTKIRVSAPSYDAVRERFDAAVATVAAKGGER